MRAASCSAAPSRPATGRHPAIAAAVARGHRPAPAQPGQARLRAALSAKDLGDAPVPGAFLLDGDVLDGRLDDALVGARLDRPLDELGQHESLVGALLKAAHIDQAGRDDLPPVDARHAGHRHEDAPLARHLDGETDDAGALAVEAEGDDDVADPADLITSTVRRNEFSPASRLKTLSYLDNVLARAQAR